MYTTAFGVHGSLLCCSLYKVASFIKPAFLSLGNGLKNSAAHQSIKLGKLCPNLEWPEGMLPLEI